MPGQRPISTLVRRPRFTLMPRLSFSNLLGFQESSGETSHSGCCRRSALKVRIICNFPASIKSTIRPRSPAFLEIRSGAQVRMPLYLLSLISSTISLKTGRCPVSLAEWLSRFIVTTSSPSRSASWSISLICESMDSTCFSSDSLLFLHKGNILPLRGLLPAPQSLMALVLLRFSYDTIDDADPEEV